MLFCFVKVKLSNALLAEKKKVFFVFSTFIHSCHANNK